MVRSSVVTRADSLPSSLMPSSACANAPWYTAPVIVGGSGGSGTRGAALLLETLGVAMACMTSDFLVPQAGLPRGATNKKHGHRLANDSNACDLKCNPAADCGVISSFRTGKAVGGHGVLSWMRHINASHTHMRHHFPETMDVAAEGDGGARHVHGQRDPWCSIQNEAALSDAMSRPAEVCGGSKQAAIARLRELVAPQHRRPLRWGLKNPHATYYANVLFRLFPCMVFVNTVRDLPVMVRTAKHFESRVQEAVRYGVISEASVKSHKSSLASSQQFYGSFLRRVNGGLHRWLARCEPHRYAHMPLQRLVILGADQRSSASSACFHAVMGPLYRALRIDVTPETINATHRFLAKSLSTVKSSLREAAQRPLALAVGEEALAWPMAMNVEACRGDIMPQQARR